MERMAETSESFEPRPAPRPHVDRLAVFEGERGRLFGLAYRMLGRVTDAEDAVQETFVRWAAADQAAIDNPAGWLTTVCTRICLDVLRSAQHARESYVGPWLPEPLWTSGGEPAPEEAAGLSESVTLAFLVVLESLSPLERAVFVLHDVFGYTHAEVAVMVERTPEAVRQLVSRARRHLQERRPRYERDAERRRQVADAFLRACLGQDLDGLLQLLAPDVEFVADGGGKVTSVPRPVAGAERVAKLLLGLARAAPADMEVRQAEVNAMPAVIAYVGGSIDSVLALDIWDGRITAIRGVRNPEKLRALERSPRT